MASAEVAGACVRVCACACIARTGASRARAARGQKLRAREAVPEAQERAVRLRPHAQRDAYARSRGGRRGEGSRAGPAVGGIARCSARGCPSVCGAATCARPAHPHRAGGSDQGPRVWREGEDGGAGDGGPGTNACARGRVAPRAPVDGRETGGPTETPGCPGAADVGSRGRPRLRVGHNEPAARGPRRPAHATEDARCLRGARSVCCVCAPLEARRPRLTRVCCPGPCRSAAPSLPDLSHTRGASHPS
jgi:hypothetical protein